MPETLDLLVVGTGSAGQTVAHRCAKEGWKVAVADDRPYGGTCALRGCDPKKVFVAAAEAADWQRRMDGRGLAEPEARIDWSALQAFKRTFTESVPEKTEKSLRDAGIRTLHGTARFRSPETVEVDGEVFAPETVVLATGAEPMSLGFEGEDLLTHSDAFLDLEELPGEITFVGGGFISFELAHVAARAGARVRILEMMERPLGPFDADLVSVLVSATRDLGVQVETETRVTRVERRNGGFRVEIEGPGGPVSHTAELVVHGAGRVPRLDGLDLEAGGIERGKRGVRVDQHLRSVSNPRVFAAGDASETGPPLTPVAGAQGRVVAANLLGTKPADETTVDTSPVPSVVFTLPPLAAVGLTADQAEEEGLNVEVHHHETAGWYTSRRIGEKHAAHKVLVEKGTGRLVGAHLLGHGSEEAINLFALAMHSGLRADDLRRATWAYPTKSSDLSYML